MFLIEATQAADPFAMLYTGGGIFGGGSAVVALLWWSLKKLWTSHEEKLERVAAALGIHGKDVRDLTLALVEHRIATGKDLERLEEKQDLLREDLRETRAEINKRFDDGTRAHEEFRAAIHKHSVALRSRQPEGGNTDPES